MKLQECSVPKQIVFLFFFFPTSLFIQLLARHLLDSILFQFCVSVAKLHWGQKQRNYFHIQALLSVLFV